MTKENVIDIYGYIDTVSLDNNIVSPQSVSEQLKDIGPKEEIIVNINSNGGDVFSGVAIYNMLKKHNAKIIVNIDGIAASIASVIAMAGDEIHMPGNAVMMIHNAWSSMQGDARKMRKQAETLERINSIIFNSYTAKNPKIDKDKLQKMMDEETWFTAEEAKNLGFVDKVTANEKVAAAIYGMVFGGVKQMNDYSFKNDEEPDETKKEPTANEVMTLLEKILEVTKDTNSKVNNNKVNKDKEDDQQVENSFARLFNMHK